MNLSFDSPFVIPAAATAVAITLLKLTCVLLMGVLASALMRRGSASARHLVWLVALVAALVLPFWSAWSPLPVHMLPAAASPVLVSTNVPEQRPTLNTPVERKREPSHSIATARPARRFGVGTILLAIWVLGAVALLARLSFGGWLVRGILRRARELEQADWQQPVYEIADRLELDQAPRLLQSDRVKMPFATGFLKAVIVLPAESVAWTHERRCAVLIHELAHVKRRDLIGHLVGAVACALYWFHPLVWKAASRLRAESERACDDLALVLGTPAHDYAEHLLEIVAQVREDHMPAVALAMAKPREFEGRMLAILDPRHSRRAPTGAQAAWLVGSLAALALLVGAVSPARRVTASPLAPAEVATSASPVSEKESETIEPAKLASATDPKADPSANTSIAPPESEPVHVQQAAPPEQLAQAQDEAGTDEEESKNTKGSRRIQILASTLRTDSDAEVRRVAAWGLARYGANADAARALADAVVDDGDAEVREMATWALAGSRTTATLTALETARRDKDPDVRRTAIWATGSIGSRASVEGLTRQLSDADPSVREVTAWAIGSCSPSLAPAPLVRALGDTDPNVRFAAAWALYSIGDPNTADDLEAAFGREKVQEVRGGILHALGSMGKQAIPTLTRLVDSPDPEIRRVAVAALAGGNASGPWPWPRPDPRPYP